LKTRALTAQVYVDEVDVDEEPDGKKKKKESQTNMVIDCSLQAKYFQPRLLSQSL
jgi:hypothetical protein